MNGLIEVYLTAKAYLYEIRFVTLEAPALRASRVSRVECSFESREWRVEEVAAPNVFSGEQSQRPAIHGDVLRSSQEH